MVAVIRFSLDNPLASLVTSLLESIPYSTSKASNSSATPLLLKEFPAAREANRANLSAKLLSLHNIM